jgi:hypothetical protein
MSTELIWKSWEIYSRLTSKIVFSCPISYNVKSRMLDFRKPVNPTWYIGILLIFISPFGLGSALIRLLVLIYTKPDESMNSSVSFSRERFYIEVIITIVEFSAMVFGLIIATTMVYFGNDMNLSFNALKKLLESYRKEHNGNKILRL